MRDEPQDSIPNPFFKRVKEEVISLKRAVDILNKFKHKTGDVWTDQSWKVEDNCARNEEGCYLSEFEVVAIAKEYLREAK